MVVFLALVLALTTAAGVAVSSSSSPVLPVIVRALAGSTAAAERSILSVGGEISRPLAILDGFAARVPAAALARLARMAGIAAVTYDAPLRPLHAVDGFDAEEAPGSLYNMARHIGARNYWARGFFGSGVDVAVIDTGLSPVAGLDTGDKVVRGPDFSFESQAPNLRHLDSYGHGTHMAGIIAGLDPVLSSSLSQVHHDFIGVAPGSRVVSLKVANAMGATDVSQVIAAIDWVVTNKDADGLNIRVLNLSFGTDGTQHYTLDPLSYAVEKAWHSGIAVVVAAGNAGFGSAKLNNPAYNPFVIAVGANNTRGTTKVSDDVIPSFSSTGDQQRNPDLVAPGQSIVSLRVPGSQLDVAHPEGRVNARFFKGSGTSQAAAVISGAAALIVQQRPNISPDQLKQLLTSTAVSLPNADPIAQGAGMVNLAAAIDTPTKNSAVQDWPRSVGGGSLDAARGSLRVVDPTGVELGGEIDIFGKRFSYGARDAGCAAAGTDEAAENQATAGEGCHDIWNADRWTSDAWEGNTWSGNSWSGNSWSGNSWSGNSWSGNSWSGNSWSGNSW
ncbi:MAG: S8 family serine peptidase, partial [Chloroflexota bacterium]|nr:S8 family serine peptidase [Chloroflexota bacterium]